MKEKKCCICETTGTSLDRLWPYGHGTWICSSCSLVESIHDSGESHDVYDYDEYERWGANESYNR